MDVWQPRMAALVKVFGAADDSVLTAIPPIYMGGGADIVCFPNYLGGVAYVTAGLTGGVEGVDQAPSQMGNYELVMCTKERCRGEAATSDLDKAQRQDWAPNFLSQFAVATLTEPYDIGDTMDFPLLEDSAIEALLFLGIGPKVRFGFGGKTYGLLLCLGITQSELNRCRKEGSHVVVKALKDAGVFPWTDPKRASVIK